MKLDPDYVREILLDIEEQPAKLQPITGESYFELSFDGRSVEETSEYVHLMQEAGFMEALRMVKPGLRRRHMKS